MIGKIINFGMKISNHYFVSLPKFRNELNKFKQLSGDNIIIEPYPILNDMASTTPFDRDYMYHPSWAARKIAQINPEIHVDIGSTLILPAILSAFIPTEFYDYRPADIKLSNLKSGQADLMNLHFKNNSIKSLSCLSTIEHIGLGRYGDPLNANGDKKAMSELSRVLAKGGDLLIAVPVGTPRVIFNAHRIYSYDQIIDNFKDLELVEYSLIKTSGTDGILVNPKNKNPNISSYDCGCFWFKKK